MGRKVTIITPCFNEGVTVIKFLQKLEEALAILEKEFLVIVVDDSSNDNTLSLLYNFNFKNERIDLRVLELKYNVGHQGAIYQGMLFASKNIDSDTFIIMDSDGEDDPFAIKDILLKKEKNDIVHVIRGRRSEGQLFRFFYFFYQLLFRMVTRNSMNFGNYSMINRKVLETVVSTGFVHFAAYLSKLRLEFGFITVDRKKRIDGKSKMNLSSLLGHAFKSFVEYADQLLMVFLKLFLILITIFIFLIGNVLYKKLFTEQAILGWASTLIALLFNSALICLGFFVLGIILLNISSKSEMKNRESIFRD